MLASFFASGGYSPRTIDGYPSDLTPAFAKRYNLMPSDDLHSTQSDRPLVSVVIPTYNRAATISRALESVLQQSTTRLEIIIVDDASVDATVEMIEAIVDPRVKVISLPARGGANAARNRGVKSATGEWLAFQDSDDEWLPFKLEAHLARAEESGADVIWSPVLTATDDPRTVPYAYTSGPFLGALCSSNFISLQATLISRAAFEAVGGLDEKLPRYQDWDLWFKLARAGFAFAEHPAPSVRLYLSDDSITADRSLYGYAMRSLLEAHASTYRMYPIAELKHRSRLIRYHMRNRAPVEVAQQLVASIRAIVAVLARCFREAMP
jgi:glycosyltransferase involved in cell wall biosynthesis